MYTTLTPVIGLFQKKQGEELRVEFPGVNKKQYGIFRGDQERKT